MSVAMPAGADRVRIQPPPSRLRAGGLTDSERNFALAMHLTPLAGLIFALFVITSLLSVFHPSSALLFIPGSLPVPPKSS